MLIVTAPPHALQVPEQSVSGHSKQSKQLQEVWVMPHTHAHTGGVLCPPPSLMQYTTQLDAVLDDIASCTTQHTSAALASCRSLSALPSCRVR